MTYFMIGTPRVIIGRTLNHDWTRNTLSEKLGTLLTTPNFNKEGALSVVLRVRAHTSFIFKPCVYVWDKDEFLDEEYSKLEETVGIHADNSHISRITTRWGPNFFGIVGALVHHSSGMYVPQLNVEISLRFENTTETWSKQSHLEFPIKEAK